MLQSDAVGAITTMVWHTSTHPRSSGTGPSRRRSQVVLPGRKMSRQEPPPQATCETRTPKENDLYCPHRRCRGSYDLSRHTGVMARCHANHCPMSVSKQMETLLLVSIGRSLGQPRESSSSFGHRGIPAKGLPLMLSLAKVCACTREISDKCPGAATTPVRSII